MTERPTETVSIEVIDSHTGGEPTRVVLTGVPDLTDAGLTDAGLTDAGTSGRTVADQLACFRDHYDHYRTAIVTEPRGNDVLVGALLCPPADPSAEFGVIFFNNVGYLGMCGHGMIGLVATLRHMGWVQTGSCRIETPVGTVEAIASADGSVSITNVDSYRKAKDVAIELPELGTVVGDVAWGGNWFYLVKEPTFDISLDHVNSLQNIAATIRRVINQSGYPEVDHVELFAADGGKHADSRNFVLCPGMAYDRSPCGTGTSAKLACLAADGTLDPGAIWLQAGVLGTTFMAHYQPSDSGNGRIVPVITGTAFVTGQSKLQIRPDDPFAWGIQ